MPCKHTAGRPIPQILGTNRSPRDDADIQIDVYHSSLPQLSS